MQVLRKIMRLNRQNLFLLFLILLVFIVKFNFFVNTYIFLKNNIDVRLEEDYGYCFPMGYGFIKDNLKKHNLNKENITYYNKNIYPSSELFTFSFKSKKSNKIIFLNYELKEIKKKIKKFKILENLNNCYLVELE